MFGFRRREGRAEILARTLLANRDTSGLAQVMSDDDESYGTRFIMPLPLFSSGTSFFIRDSRGENVMKADGELYRYHGLILLKNLQGRDLYRTSTRLVDIPEAMYIEKPTGEVAAVVRNAFLSTMNDCWTVLVQGSEDFSAVGDIQRHSYSLHFHSGPTLATVARNRRWFSSSLVVDVSNSVMAPLIMAVVISIHVLSRGRAKRPLASIPRSARAA